MKAWVVEDQKSIDEFPLKMVELPDPIPGEGEIKIKIAYCGICRTDLHIAEGDLPLKKRPLVPGHEIIGEVVELGRGVRKFRIGDIAGISWLNSSCGRCKFCLEGRENYCTDFVATGWNVNGGFAEYTVINENYAFNLEGINMPMEYMAPLMCPGIAGMCTFNLTELKGNQSLGIYGFGPTAFYLMKIAEFLDIRVYVITRSQKHAEMAENLGAVWVSRNLNAEFPEKMDSIILFPPVGELVEMALGNTMVGGNLVLSAVYMTPITVKNYSTNLWGRNIKTLYNVNRRDANQFLDIVRKIDMRIPIKVYEFDKLQQAMIAMKRGELEELVAVLKIG